MIQYICDICKQAFPPDDASTSIYKYATHVIIPGSKGMSPKGIEEIYCGECSNKIKNFINEQKSITTQGSGLRKGD